MNIFLLGASGSIGKQTLDVIREYNHKLIGCSLGRDKDYAKKVIDEFKPEIVCLREKTGFENKYPDIKFVYGDEGLLEVSRYKNGMLVNALMGSVGLKPTVEAIKARKDIALANKETLVMAGDIIKKLVKEYGVRLLPIDSEHSAIWQAIKGEKHEDIKKLIITASGGSFRDKSRDELVNVSVSDALNHPNWKMGSKITIDSATMMNKGLEVIEAHHLFDVPYEQIETILHQESIVHSLVEFKDSSIKAQLGVSDMRMPIIYAINGGNRVEYNNPLVLGDLHFKPMDFKRFPMLEYAYRAGKMGGIAPVVLNASNEAAVTLFLNGKISFLEIEEIVKKELDNFENFTPSLDEIILMDKKIKEKYLGGE